MNEQSDRALNGLIVLFLIIAAAGALIYAVQSGQTNHWGWLIMIVGGLAGAAITGGIAGERV
jgi:hypothetical protein